jgi:hypothetical protein
MEFAVLPVKGLSKYCHYLTIILLRALQLASAIVIGPHSIVVLLPDRCTNIGYTT